MVRIDVTSWLIVIDSGDQVVDVIGDPAQQLTRCCPSK